MTCNVDSVRQVSSSWYYREYQVRMSKQTIADLEAAIVGGEGASYILSRFGSGKWAAMLASDVAVALAGILLMYGAWIYAEQDNCGVVIHFYLTANGFHSVTVTSQG